MAQVGSGVLSRFPHSNHNHARCVAAALASAERICEEREARLTQIRRRVLELVWSSHTPVVAYDVLERLKPEKANATPVTVYRALEFLMDQGLIHRIESMNAYVGCAAPEMPHTGQFLICTGCEAVAELECNDILDQIAQRAGDIGFVAHSHTIEVTGLCTRCVAKRK